MTSNIGTGRILIDADTSGLERSLGRISGRLGGIAARAFAAIGATGAALAGQALNVAGDFEEAATKIVNLTSITEDQMAMLDDQIIEIGRNAGITGEKAAEGFFFLASGLGDAEAATAALDAAAKGAAVGLGDVESLSRTAVTVFSQYGDAAGSASDIMDTFGAAATASTLGADELARGLQGAIPGAAQLGIGLDNLAATAAIISPAFASGSEAGNALTGVITALNRATPQAESELAKVGLSMEQLRDIAGEQGLSGVIQTLGVAFEGQEEKLTRVLGRVEGTRAVMGFLGRSSEDVAAAFDTVANKAGFLDQSFANVTKNVNFLGDRALASLNARFQSLGERLLPQARSSLETLPGVIDTVFDKIEGAVDTIFRLAGVFDDAGRGIDGFKAVLADIDFSGIFEGLVDVARDAFESLVDFLTSGGAEQIIEGILDTREKLLDAAITVFEALVEGVTEILPDIVTTITTKIIPRVVDTIERLAPRILNAAIALFKGLIDGIVRILPTLLATASNVVRQVVGLLVDLLPILVDGAVTLFLGLVDALLAILPDLVTTITDVIIPSIVDLIVTAVPTLVEAAVELFLALVEGVLTILPELLEVLTDEVIPTVLETLTDALPDLLDAAITLFFGLVDGVIDVLPDLINTLTGDVIPEVIATLTDPDMIGKILDGAIALFTALVDALVDVLPTLLVTLAEDVIPAVVTALTNPETIGKIAGAALTLFLALIQGLVSAAGQLVKTLITVVLPEVLRALGGAVADMFKAGANWIVELGKGMLSAVPDLLRKVKNAVVRPITNLLPNSPAKDGPFRQFPPEKAGENVVRLFAEGMRRGAEALPSAAFGTAGGGGINVGGVSLSVVVNGNMTREQATETGQSLGDAFLERLSRAKVTQ